MIITGIVAEFNPFHNGHKHLLDHSEGLKIIAMSGNFMQRGEPAIIDKWTRTQMALDAGADLVIELPFLVSVQSADQFAQGAIDILTQLGINQLTFGTEEMINYNQIAKVYQDQHEEMQTFIESLPKELSYPQKSQAMWENFTGISFANQTPNHILGLAYAKAAADKKINLKPIPRLGAGFHSDEKVAIASATALRKHRSDAIFVQKAMPDSQKFLTSPHLTWNHYFDFLRYRIITSQDLTVFVQVNKELATRISSAIRSAKDFDQLLELVTTKRYTKARVRRALTYILIGAKEENLPEEIHVLGFSKAGRQHLKSIKKTVPLISRIGQKAWDPLTQQADLVYQLGHPELIEQHLGRFPLIPKKEL